MDLASSVNLFRYSSSRTHTAIDKSSENASTDILMLVLKFTVVISKSPYKWVRHVCHPTLKGKVQRAIVIDKPQSTVNGQGPD